MENKIKLGIETLKDKDLLLVKLGLFFALATHIEKMLAEYIFEKTQDDKLRDAPLGTKERKFNRITNELLPKRYTAITLLLSDFRERRNDITHKTLIIDPHYFESAFSINWRNEETSDEISVEGYIKFVSDSILIGRELLLELVTLFLYEDLPDRDFEKSKETLMKMPFCFNNKHC